MINDFEYLHVELFHRHFKLHRKLYSREIYDFYKISIFEATKVVVCK